MHPQSSPVLPAPRGPMSSWVIRRFGRPHVRSAAPPVERESGWSEDLQLALYLCHHTHLRPSWSHGAELEWDAELISFRSDLEDRFLNALDDDVAAVLASAPSGSGRMRTGDEVVASIRSLIAADTSPSVSRFLERAGTIDHYRDAVTARAAYQLTEGDFHTFAIPRLAGRAKQLLAAIQAGEYGADEPGRELHSALFARTMRAFGLDDRPYALLGRQRASALAVSNLISTLSLRSARRGALVGHLAVFEMTSVEPMARNAVGLRRLEVGDDACRFYDVHVLADAEHEHMAAEMVAALVDDEPHLADDAVRGAAAALVVERRYAEDLMRHWSAPQHTGHHQVAV